VGHCLGFNQNFALSSFLHLLAALNGLDHSFEFTQLYEFRLRLSGLCSATVPKGL
jgi:hypothetical protein